MAEFSEEVVRIVRGGQCNTFKQGIVGGGQCNTFKQGIVGEDSVTPLSSGGRTV